MNSMITKLAAVVFFVVGFEVDIGHLLASWTLTHELETNGLGGVEIPPSDSLVAAVTTVSGTSLSC